MDLAWINCQSSSTAQSINYAGRCFAIGVLGCNWRHPSCDSSVSLAAHSKCMSCSSTLEGSCQAPLILAQNHYPRYWHHLILLRVWSFVHACPSLTGHPSIRTFEASKNISFRHWPNSLLPGALTLHSASSSQSCSSSVSACGVPRRIKSYLWSTYPRILQSWSPNGSPPSWILRLTIELHFLARREEPDDAFSEIRKPSYGLLSQTFKAWAPWAKEWVPLTEE